MAHFESPPDGKLGEYDVDSKLAVGSIWRMRMQVRGEGAEVALWGGAGLTVRSNNPAVLPTPVGDRKHGSLRIFHLHGQKVGTAMLEAAPGSGARWVSLQVQVVEKLERGNGERMLVLTGPHASLNAVGTPVLYDMKFDRTIASETPISSIVNAVSSLGSLRHLVLSCHGQIVYDYRRTITDSRILLGRGFGRADIAVFAQLGTKMRGGVIWLGACALGNDGSGNMERAQRSGCYVVAPIQYMQLRSGQSRLKLPLGAIDMYEQFMPTVFAPTGTKIAWRHFLGLGSVLGFRIS